MVEQSPFRVLQRIFEANNHLKCGDGRVVYAAPFEDRVRRNSSVSFLPSSACFLLMSGSVSSPR